MKNKELNGIFTSTIKNYYHYFVAFFGSILLMGIAYAWFGIYPFGKESVLVLDMYGQYMDYFANFRNIIAGDKSFLYSWSRNLGGEMMGLTAYYVSSPFSLITALFPKENITEAVLVMQMLKIGSMGLTMAIYLRTSKNIKKINTILFSLLYALSAYTVVQAMNIMWLDCLILLPLVTLGVENIIKHNKYKLFLISLPVMFIANFYIAYMVGMFAAVYFIYYFFYTYELKDFKKIFKKAGIFFGCTLIAAGCSLFLIIPTYFGMKMGKFDFNDTNLAFKSMFDLYDLFAMMLPGAYDTVRNEGLPFIYTGTITLLLLPAYFLNPKINKKHKALSAGMLGFLMLSFTINTLDNAWHIFKTPNWLPHRNSFIFSFFMVVLASQAFEYIRSLKRTTVIKVYVGVLFGIFIIQKLDYDFLTAEENIWLALVCISGYIIFLTMLQKTKRRKLLTALLILTISVELTVDACQLIYDLDMDVVYSTRSSYTDFISETQPVVDAVYDYDDSFYRLGTTFRRTKNDALSLGYNGLAHSSSTLNLDILDFMELLGISVRGHWAGYYGMTLASDSLLGFKYVLTKDENGTGYEQYKNVDLIDSKISVYQNKYTMPVGFTVSDRLDKVFLYGKDPLRQQNKILSGMTDKMYEEFFKPIDVERFTSNLTSGQMEYGHDYFQILDNNRTASVEFLFKAIGDNPVYAYFPTDYEREVEVTVNGEELGEYFGNDTYGVLNIGSFSDKDDVSLKMTLKEDDLYLEDAYIYYLDMDMFKNTIRDLKQNALKITERTETKITGTVNVDAKKPLLYTSIPYEKGWRVKVDGKKVETKMVLDALLGFKLTEGKHQVELRFIPQGFVLGSTISVFSFIVLIIVLIINSKRKTRKIKQNKEEQRI